MEIEVDSSREIERIFAVAQNDGLKEKPHPNPLLLGEGTRFLP
jgi:hypothetical protein